MFGRKKPKDAEDILSEFQKTQVEQKPKFDESEQSTNEKFEKIKETTETFTESSKVEQTPPAPKPEPVLESPEPEPVLEAPKPEPVLESPEPEPVLEAPKPEPVLESPEPEPVLDSPKDEDMQVGHEEPQLNKEIQNDDEGVRERNVIFVGTKPIMTYVTATLTQLASQPTVTIKARGKRITQAVDVSQMIVKRMNTVGYTISDVRIASDSLTSQDGKQRNVSTMEIDIKKIDS